MKVSAIIPAYNCNPCLNNTIGSTLNKTFTYFVLVICDDGSTDDSWPVIRKHTDSRIRKYHNKENLGYLRAYRTAFYLFRKALRLS